MGVFLHFSQLKPNTNNVDELGSNYVHYVLSLFYWLYLHSYQLHLWWQGFPES